MGHAKRNKLVFTVKDKCRVCYTCVRECPVKAIKIINGQAEVLSERCIGCGNCVNVCSQGAKVFFDSKNEVEKLLQSESNVAACIAPSFPAEFSDIADYKCLVGMIKKLGFDKVIEVAFGADIVAKEYRNLIDTNSSHSYISSDCPSIVFYIEHYHPELVKNLAPIVSPMVATTRIIKEKYGNDYKIVFMGPCIAKKAESDEVDEVLTFRELRNLFAKYKISSENVEKREFDPPYAGKGSIFPVSRGLLQNVNKTDDIVDGEIIVAAGKSNFKEAIKDFENGEIEMSHLEVLCCNGCIMGPGMTNTSKHLYKRNQISNYVKSKLENLDEKSWEKSMLEFSNVCMFQKFEPVDRRLMKPEREQIDIVLQQMGKHSEKQHLNCGACGYDTCEEHAVAVVQGLAENEMCLPYSIEKLHNLIDELNISNEKLANAKQALKHSEKLANMGQLSAGIAHELNNPLGVITMYSNILKDETSKDSPLHKDLELIVEQTDRCKKIVGGLLNFARKNQVRIKDSNILKFIEHSLESVVIPENISVKVIPSINDSHIMIDEEQMMQAITNIEKNAIEAMPSGGNLIIELEDNTNQVEIKISDTGVGIPKENMDKLFTPFFTTKEPGKGTGLGLPLVYGIIKMHKGQINVFSNTDTKKGKTGTTFKIIIPRYN
ncbi:MAG TPA: histidine kinase [Bacteroidales bacterium]|nr:MAG: histidine kinase [Bacteroidetes bacterium GWF2_33_38]OFY67936.1 MAG: histidine kinase [Bacteroidetes bacterium RIFOXYA12_FULL_33_9]OFY85288.1 MAG: histidine kinase [Bacteroidetes bacterium RIFOXYA2_FULL_33_7]HBF87486.1 histidine kinase [Bacteroidales bacterium]